MDRNALHSRTLPLARVICKCILGSCLNVFFCFFVFQDLSAMLLKLVMSLGESFNFLPSENENCGLDCPYLFPVLHIVYLGCRS